jgi:2-polyprenyl-3-methyl-5-hydroxy-6-metoxy-1,4-benzoquinol methylase
MDNNSNEFNKLNEILLINKKQKIFYNSPRNIKIKGIIMEIWSKIRRPMYSLMWHSGISNNIFLKELEWMGDLRGKKVLDFGCFSGNDLSIHLADKSRYYMGIDLSDVAISQLKEKMVSKNINNPNVKAIDILSPDFKEKDFDIIYAEGVIHHFKHIDTILSTLANKLSPGGLVITFDPLQAAITSRIIRSIYRPFRSDKEWEFPFTRNTFNSIQKHFNIVGIQGIMGYSKWSIPMAFINKSIALKMTKYLHQKDLKKANKVGPGLWKCLHVSMCWSKK